MGKLLALLTNIGLSNCKWGSHYSWVVKWKRINKKLKAPRTVFTTFYFFVTYEWTKWCKMLDYIMLERLGGAKHSSFFGPFISYKETKCCEYGHSTQTMKLFCKSLAFKWDYLLFAKNVIILAIQNHILTLSSPYLKIYFWRSFIPGMVFGCLWMVVALVVKLPNYGIHGNKVTVVLVKFQY